MEMFEIEERLRTIKDRYEDVRVMTETIDIDSVEACRDIIEARGRLLSDIFKHQQDLDKKFYGWRDLCVINENLAKHCEEIQKIITSALALDGMLQQQLQNRMEKNRQELFAVTHRSRAAMSYNRQRSRTVKVR